MWLLFELWGSDALTSKSTKAVDIIPQSQKDEMCVLRGFTNIYIIFIFICMQQMLSATISQ